MKFWSVLILVALIVSCKSKKETTADTTVKMTEKVIAVKKCYTEKEIPGEENMAPKHSIYVMLSMSDVEVTLDSISYAESNYKLKKSGVIYSAKIDSFASANIATLYYTEEGKPYFSNIPRVEKKDDVYLPSMEPGEGN